MAPIRRISLEKDTKITNAATFTLQREDHTVGNLIRMYVKTSDVIIKQFLVPACFAVHLVECSELISSKVSWSEVCLLLAQKQQPYVHLDQLGVNLLQAATQGQGGDFCRIQVSTPTGLPYPHQGADQGQEEPS